MHSIHRDAGRSFTIVAAIAAASGVFAALACGPGGLYSRGAIEGAAGRTGAGSAGNGDSLNTTIGSGGSPASPVGANSVSAGSGGASSVSAGSGGARSVSAGSGNSGGGLGTGGDGSAPASKGGGGAGGAVAGATPQAGILSIDFVGGASDPALAASSIDVAMRPDEIAGVRPAANWNTAAGPMGALAALVFSDGRRAAASLTWDAPMTPTSTGILQLGYPDLPGDVRMMNGVLNPVWSDLPAAATALVTVGNLPAEVAAGGYDVYVYVLGGIPVAGERRYTYTIGGTTFNVTQAGPTPTAITAPYPYALAPDMGSGNYIVFRGVVGSTFTLLASPSASSALRAPVNGLQIVWPPGTGGSASGEAKDGGR